MRQNFKSVIFGSLFQNRTDTKIKKLKETEIKKKNERKELKYESE